MSKIVDALKEQKALELGHIEKLKPEVEKIGHPLVSALIKTIIHDSKKHATLCQALIDVEGGAAPLTLDTDMATAVSLHQSIKQHMRVEEDMISRVEALAAKAEDPRVKDILGYILSDERRHHSMLQRLSNLIDRDTTAFDEYLELFQKYEVVPE